MARGDGQKDAWYEVVVPAIVDLLKTVIKVGCQPWVLLFAGLAAAIGLKMIGLREALDWLGGLIDNIPMIGG